MNTETHTLGPWTASPVGNPAMGQDYEISTSIGETKIARVFGCMTGESADGENAYLIASAPDLLAENRELRAALADLLKLCEGGTGNALQKMDVARAALAGRGRK